MLKPLLLASLLAAGLLAGCAESETATPAAPAPPPPVPVDEAVDWTGLIGSGLCARGGVVVTFSLCGLYGPALTSPGSESSFQPVFVHAGKEGHDLAGGHLVVEWDATSVATQGLRVSAWIWKGCPDECEVDRTLLSTAGVSPIEIPVGAVDLREGMAIAVAVRPADLTAGSSASIGQEVRLTGTLSFVEDVDGDPEPEDEDDEEEEDDG